MKQFNNDSYKDEIKKTEVMAKGVFNSAFNNLYNDERLTQELEIKITKWKKDLNVFLNDNNPYQDNKTELDIALKKLKNTSKEDIFNDLNSLNALSIDTKFWREKLSNSDDLNILKKNIISVWEKTYNKKKQ